MHEVTDKFRAAIRQSRTIVAKCDLYRQGRKIGEDLPITGGTITDDASALVRRRIELDLPGTKSIMSLLPADPPEDGGLWPLGNEVHFFVGVDFEDGTDPEYVHSGVYRINRPAIQDTGDDLKIRISGYDRGRTVQRAKFTKPYNIRAGVNYKTAIRDLILSRIPWLTEDEFKLMDLEFTTPVLTFLDDDDPWEMAVNMAASCGAELLWDHHGHLEMRPEPDLSVGEPVFSYAEGEDAIITGVNRDLDDDEAFNGIVVSAEQTSNTSPIRGEAWDTDPDSPTYYDPDNPAASIYGAYPKFVTSEYVTTSSQAQAMAKSELRRSRGIVEHVDFSSIVNPLHESNDIIEIVRDQANVNNIYILESFQADVGINGTMSGTTRRRRVAA